MMMTFMPERVPKSRNTTIPHIILTKVVILLIQTRCPLIRLLLLMPPLMLLPPPQTIPRPLIEIVNRENGIKEEGHLLAMPWVLLLLVVEPQMQMLLHLPMYRPPPLHHLLVLEEEEEVGVVTTLLHRLILLGVEGAEVVVEVHLIHINIILIILKTTHHFVVAEEEDQVVVEEEEIGMVQEDQEVDSATPLIIIHIIHTHQCRRRGWAEILVHMVLHQVGDVVLVDIILNILILLMVEEVDQDQEDVVDSEVGEEEEEVVVVVTETILQCKVVVIFSKEGQVLTEVPAANIGDQNVQEVIVKI
mmetsp:Transcript_25295/g.37083  ORF Transcript_25295/g.37083 Transcript_25295/m.37083 type:complete len:304 (+) Transcript_25295:111-1022(+)